MVIVVADDFDATLAHMDWNYYYYCNCFCCGSLDQNNSWVSATMTASSTTTASTVSSTTMIVLVVAFVIAITVVLIIVRVVRVPSQQSELLVARSSSSLCIDNSIIETTETYHQLQRRAIDWQRRQMYQSRIDLVIKTIESY